MDYQIGECNMGITMLAIAITAAVFTCLYETTAADLSAVVRDSALQVLVTYRVFLDGDKLRLEVVPRLPENSNIISRMIMKRIHSDMWRAMNF